MLPRRQFLAALAAPALMAQRPARDRHVLIVSIDGFAAYSLLDETLPLPTIRGLAAEGAVAEAMEPVNPTVTWPNHTSIVTGVPPARHGVLYNGLPVRGGPGKPLRVEPWIDKPQLVQSPTLYDAAHAAGLTTAEVDWVAIHNARTITWAFPEVPRPTDAIVQEMIAAGMLSESGLRELSKASILHRDEIWTRAGEHIIRKHRPNLLLFHLLTTDSSQHRYGARSLAGYAALSLADTRVERLIQAYTSAGLRGKLTVIIVSDHGFKTYSRVIQPNALLAQKGLLGDVWTIPEGGTSMVYVTRPERKAELIPRLREMFSSVEGVTQVIGPDQFAGLGLPPPGERMADLVLAAADGFSFGGADKGDAVTAVAAGSTPGAHGYVSSDKAMDAVFVASGAGIRKGVKLGRIRNIDVAPTAARLLGLQMKDVEGRVLTAALR